MGLLWFVYEYPWAAAGVAGVLLALTIGLLVVLRRALKSLFARRKTTG